MELVVGAISSMDSDWIRMDKASNQKWKGKLMNQVILIGTLARTPEIKHVGQEKAVCNFTVITSRERNGQEWKQYAQCTAWNDTAEAMRHLAEGDRVFVEGELQRRSYEDKEGKKVWETKVVVWVVEPMGVVNPQHEMQEKYDPNPTISDEDIPF